MAKGAEELRTHIAKVRALADLARRSAPALKRAVEKETKKTAAAGTTAKGTPWRKRKIDGAPVLRNAAQEIKVTITRGVILIQITGHYARHHLGIVKGTGSRKERMRRIIPTIEIPEDTVRAMVKTATTEFRKVMA